MILRHNPLTRSRSLNFLLIFYLFLTCYISESVQQDCLQPYNFSDFTVTLVENSIVVTGGNTQNLEVWSKDISNGIHIKQNCWSSHSFDQNDSYLPYKNGIGFSLSNNSIAVQAGDSNSSALSNLSVFDLSTNTWSTSSFQGTPPSPRARMSVSLNTTSNVAFFYGGRSERTEESSQYFNAFYSFNLNTMSWEWPKVLYSGGNRPARYGHSSNLISERLFIIGGKTAVYSSEYNKWVTYPGDFQSVLIYDTAHQQAVSMATLGNIPPTRYSFSTVNAPDGKSIVLFGGQNSSTTDMLDASHDVYILDTCSLNWSKPIIKGTPPTARAGHEAVVYQNRYMIVMFGIQNFLKKVGPIYADDIAILDMNSWTWIDAIPPLNHLPPIRTTQPNCMFTFPVIVPDDNDSNATPTFNPTVVSNTDRSPSTKQLALGITFGVLGFLLLFTALVLVLMRVRKDVDAKQNPRWIPSVFSKKRKVSTPVS